MTRWQKFEQDPPPPHLDKILKNSNFFVRPSLSIIPTARRVQQCTSSLWPHLSVATDTLVVFPIPAALTHCGLEQLLIVNQSLRLFDSL